MTAKEKRAAVVAKAKSREKKNQYTQGSKRTQVGSGWSDCSSFVRWCYLQVLGQDIGGNTAAQIVNKKLTVADNNGKTVPTESNLLPGDLLYFKGTDKSRPLGVGHVELYLGSGKIIGHGSGTGPTIKVMSTYCKSRASSGKGYIKALRVIPDDGDAPAVVPADPLKHPEHGIKITESQVNLRIGPSTGYGIAKVGKKGEIYEEVDTSGWRAILVGKEVCWVSEKMSEKV
ncbi:C40 family peptidase [Eubacteriales bacterium OttesenSCG-928-N13]|nr:C40 family peptidase [Eubacteriales bacterium OttesenSCG-928-N13]